uniref:PBX homeobox interacting protein 1 n=1 Tax=Macaca nemestrina TaxID=9545 RepID=A0A2K6D629_MACNE
MCLLGALVLLGLGVLLFSGLPFPTGPMEEVELQVLPDTGSDPELLDAVGDRQDGLREQLQSSVPPDRVPSLQNMGLLLDKLAKENQDIRLLQAQLQAQKEELQSLMHQPKGLEEENAQLRGALQQGEAFQRALESELQQLRARLQGLEADCVRGMDGVCLSGGRGPQGDKLTKELPLSPAFFGEDGVFRHDRLRFRDFVDALEDSLEEVAVQQTGDDDEVDDFEDFIFSHFFGDKALKKRSGKKDKHSQSPRAAGPTEGHSHSRHHHHQHHRG